MKRYRVLVEVVLKVKADSEVDAIAKAEQILNTRVPFAESVAADTGPHGRP